MNSTSPAPSPYHSSSILSPPGAPEGCQKCGKDDDHSHLLLCEACNDEYHTYCLDPPLTSVPEGDFYCTKCKSNLQTFVSTNDELDRKVAALPPTFTQRFGEIIWAAGGQGFGWWPACIYDPRLTVGTARKLALKNIGKKHLVYFFACADAPFTVLTDPKCMTWEEGLMEELDQGKVAKGAGKHREKMFEWALQAAITENDKPIEFRLDWNHEEDPFVILAAGVGGAGSSRASRVITTNNSNNNNNNNNNKKRVMNHEGNVRDKKRNKNNNSNSNNTDGDVIPTRRSNRSGKPSPIVATIQQQQQQQHENDTKKRQLHKIIKTNRKSINDVVHAFNNANQIEETFDPDNDDQFFCKILRKVKTTTNGISDVNIGFITLSKELSTFADARKKINLDFDDDHDLMFCNWKFYIPHLGPMSSKQEMMFGSIYDLLMKNGDGKTGDGSSRYPLKVIIHDS